MNFEEQLKALIYFHLQEHDSARYLIQDMEENGFARQNIAPEGGGISRSIFSEIINRRGLEQVQIMFKNLDDIDKIENQIFKERYKPLHAKN